MLKTDGFRLKFVLRLKGATQPELNKATQPAPTKKLLISFKKCLEGAVSHLIFAAPKGKKDWPIV
jgi:hypothetical protein